ncbi:MAG: thioredoxin fold domain-containing protein [Candidatus Zixiibacteriota bacterium]
MRRFVLVLIALSAFSAAAFAQDSPDTIVWLDYARGVETAKAENKPMLVYFYRDSCPYCRKLGHGALLDTTLAVYINENIIPIKVNTESRRPVAIDSLRITEFQLANDKWLVRGVPCMWLLEPDGCRVKKLVGVKQCSGVLANLQELTAKSYGDCPNLPLAPQPRAVGADSTKKAN